MIFNVDVVLKGTDRAVSRTVTHERDAVAGWTEADAAAVLESMLREIDRVKNPDGEEPIVTLRGFSWIVEPYGEGDQQQAIIMLEIPMGAAVGGPFAVAPTELDRLIRRALAATQPRSSNIPEGGQVH